VSGPAAVRSLAVAAGLTADRVLGEPPADLHPVAGFGRLMQRLEAAMWADDRRAGVAYLATGVGLAAVVGAFLPGRRRAAGRAAGLAAATYVAVAGRALCEAAEDVAAAVEAGDLAEARQLAGRIVGRDTARLDAEAVCRAAVESVAENTVDAVTAPLVWALAAGPAGVLVYRAVNTLDAMVGHRSPRYERFGWAAARMDDAANWLPARLTAAAVVAARPRQAGAVLRAVRTQAPAHPSPNAGVVEAAFAGAIGVRLGGTNVYSGRVEDRPILGAGPGPEPADIRAACRLSGHVTVLAWAAAAAFMAAWRRR
jgi:adenosylcobinamide-phosphate synthase